MSALNRLGKDERGSALILAMVVMALMITMGIITVAMSQNSLKMVSHDETISMAQNVAEAGVDDVIAVVVANFDSTYPLGHYPAEATRFYSAAQMIKDQNQNVLGTYDVWTQQDPDIPGNLLVTSTGYDQSGASRTVKVSVNFNPHYFNYVLLPGKQGATTTATFNAKSSEWDGHHGDDDNESDHESNYYSSANIALTGNIGVSGNMVINSSQSGSDWGDDNHGSDDHHHEYDHNYYDSPGTVTFASRDLYIDTVKYTGTKSGQAPLGIQPVKSSSYVAFPTATIAGGTVKTISLPSYGSSYTGGWTRDSYNKVWKISASNFQHSYSAYSAVKISSASSGYTLEIDGSCGAPDITPTIWTETSSGGNSNFSTIKLVGPGIRLNPTNGIALMVDRGAVNITNEAFIGLQDHGALVYLSGKNGSTSLDVTGNLAMWGSVVVNGPTTFTAQGTAIKYHDHEEHDEHDRYHSTGSCTVTNDSHDHWYDDWHYEHNHRTYDTNIKLVFDDAFLSSSQLSWSWTGGGGLQAFKQNYEVE